MREASLIRAARSAKSLRRYELLGAQRSGGGGVVLLARDRVRGERVALKLVPLRGPRDRGRFEREVEALRLIDHPAVLTLREGAIEGDFGWVVTDWIEGQTLEAVLQQTFRDGAPEAWLREQFRVLAEGLQSCHAAGVIHRDIKPSNIIIESWSGRPVLVDFGICATPEMAGGLTQTGDAIGTPGFLAPEQLDVRGEFGEMGPATDIWGFGATLFYALAESSPLPQGSAMQLYLAMLEGEPELPPEARQRSPELAALCQRCLRRDPQARPGLDEVLAALAARRRLAPALLGGLAAALLCGLGALWWSQPPAPAPLVSAETEGPLTQAASVRVRGRLDAPGEVSIGGRRTRSSPSGEFSLSVPLTPGENLILVEAGGRREELRVTRDDAPPELELFNLRDARGRPILEPGWELRGRVRDSSQVRVEADGAALEVNAEGFFTVAVAPFDALGTAPLALRAVDELGAERALALELVPPERVRAELGPEVARRAEGLAWLEARELPAQVWSCALELEGWRRAEAPQRRAVGEDLAQRLGEGWRLLGLRPCPMSGLEVVALQQRGTGLEFHLIPGGVLPWRWWEEPEMGYVIGYLEGLASPYLDVHSAADIARSAPYAQLREGVAALFELSFPEDVSATVNDEVDAVERLRAAVAADPEGLMKIRTLARRHLRAYLKTAVFVEAEERVWPFLMAVTEVPTRVTAADAGRPVPFQFSEQPSLESFETAAAWVRRHPPLRLPTELEWEWACRAGVTTRYTWGDDPSGAGPELRAAARGEARLWPAGREGASVNGFGLQDMLGNAEEWCAPPWELWRERLKGRAVPFAMRERAPLRGGSVDWSFAAMGCSQVVYRHREESWGLWGFRPAASLPQPQLRGEGHGSR